MTSTEKVEALYAGAHWMLDRERHVDAAHFFRAMMLETPTDERAWVGLAHCHEQIGQDNEAMELYMAGTLATGGSTRCQVGLARLYRRIGEPALAHEALCLAEESATELDAELVSYERNAQ
jgi:predicted Zn-dependent protease